ncbi:Thymidylate kinase [hydrothermal vent metagenome]|uniref:dTMP kinase n=1 Tax=hydrothermal vent metagenome TaxID=652676 RepID=A0A3B1EA20_9ZZZZ
MYVVIEGIDTAGKSTQLNYLHKKYPTAVITKEPGATRLGKKIRDIALNDQVNSNIAEMFLFLADRAEHIENIITPNIKNTIISDRSLISGIAYANQLTLKSAISLNLMAINNILPTHVILLELTREELRKRLNSKSNDTIESRGIDYLINIQERLKESIKLLKLNYIFINADEDRNSIAQKIDNFLEKKL